MGLTEAAAGIMAFYALVAIVGRLYGETGSGQGPEVARPRREFLRII